MALDISYKQFQENIKLAINMVDNKLSEVDDVNLPDNVRVNHGDGSVYLFDDHGDLAKKYQDYAEDLSNLGFKVLRIDLGWHIPDHIVI